MTREEFEARVLAAARGWLGVRFLHNGRAKSQGVDCLGLIVCVLREVGAPCPDGDGESYAADWYLHTPEERYLGGLLAHGVPVALAALRPGDVPYFRAGLLGRVQSDAVTHGGLSLGGARFVHAVTGRTVAEADLRHRAWAATCAGAIRLKAVLALLGEDAS